MIELLKNKFTLISIVTILASLLSLQISAAQLYRYKNDAGGVVLNHTIPSKFIAAGYEILNEQGRVIEKIAPALSKEAIQTRDRLLELEEQRAIKKQKQDIIDNELQQLYSHPNDAVRILDRRLLDIEGVTQIKLSRITNAKNQIRLEEQAAADRQRRGLDVTESILAMLTKQKAIITREALDISELYSELTKLLVEFDIKIKRLEIITNHAASDYPALEEKASKFLSNRSSDMPIP